MAENDQTGRRTPGCSLRFYMGALAVLTIVPLLALGIYTTARYAAAERLRVERFVEMSMDAAALAVDARIEVVQVALRVMADRADVASVSEAALLQGVRHLLPDAPVEKLHVLEASEPPAQAGFVLRAPIGGSGGNVLEAILSPSLVSDHLESMGFGGPYDFFVFDEAGLPVTGSASGTRSPAVVRTGSGAANAVDVGPSATGGTRLAFFRPLPRSDHQLMVTIEDTILTEPLAQSIASFGLAGLQLIFLGAAAATYLARIFTASHHRLLEAAADLGRGRRVEPIRTRLREINIVGEALASASVKLADRSEELRRSNLWLERRVAARTRELNESGELLRATLDGLPKGIVRFDAGGAVLLVNRLAARMFEGPLAGKLCADDLRTAVSGAAPRRSLDTACESVERELCDGTILEIRAVPLPDGSTVCSFVDVTERFRTAEELRRAKAQAEEAARAKDDFLANMSHELRTPLNAVLGYADLLMLDTSLGERNQERVRRMRGAGWALLTVLNDILDYARTTSAEPRIEPVWFDLAEVVEDALSIVRPACVQKGLALDLHIEEGTARQLRGDPNRIRQILINLLNNAAKFTLVGFVRLTICGRDLENGRDAALTFSVQDSGIGIPDDQQGAIFERFHQVHNPASPLGGTGLGLAICRQLVQSMGGSIWLRSSLDIGTTIAFSLVLPAGSRTDAASAAGAAGLARILLADDDEMGREVATELFKAAGLRVECVSNGAEAVEAATGRAFDLIVMDMKMPVMDGFEAARRIRAANASVRPAIVACSASAVPDEILGSDDRLFDAYVPKPLNMPAIERMLAATVEAGLLPECRAAGLSKAQLAEAAQGLAAMIGEDRIQAGLDRLLAVLQDILSMAGDRSFEAGKVRDLSHYALTSARLFEMEGLAEILKRLEGEKNDHALYEQLVACRMKMRMAECAVAALRAERFGGAPADRAQPGARLAAGGAA